MILYCDDCGRMCSLTEKQMQSSKDGWNGPFCIYCGAKIPEQNALEEGSHLPQIDESDYAHEGCEPMGFGKLPK